MREKSLDTEGLRSAWAETGGGACLLSTQSAQILPSTAHGHDILATVHRVCLLLLNLEKTKQEAAFTLRFSF